MDSGRLSTSRRGFLKYGVLPSAVGIAGCAGIDNIAKEVSQGATSSSDTPTSSDVDLPKVENPPEELMDIGIDEELTIGTGRYQYWEWDLTDRLPITIDSTVVVREGPPIDYFVTDNEELQAMEDGDRFALFEPSVLQTTLVENGWEVNETENLVVVVDNSRVGDSPDQELPAEVDIEVEFE